MKIRAIVAAIVAVMMIPVLCSAGDIILIGNESVQTSFLSKHDVSSIFLGQKTTWDDGTKIVFCIQKGSPVHETFLRKYIRKTSAQYTNYWKKQVFSGKGSSPPSFDSDEEVVKFVAETEGAIGYVSSSAGLDKVKTINVR